MNSRLACSLSTAALLFTIGCVTPAVNIIEPAVPTAAVSVAEHRQVIADKRLAARLGAVEIRQSRTPNGNLQLQATFFAGPRTTKFLYRFEWFDEQGMPAIDLDNNQWFSTAVLPNDTVTIGALAPTPRCTDFRIHLKEIR